MKKIVLFSVVFAFMGVSCKKSYETKIELAEYNNSTSVNNVASSSSFNLVSFTVKKGQIIKNYPYCDLYTVNISWTATGETNISKYDLEKSSLSNFSPIWILSSFTSSNNNASITRTYTDHGNTNGAGITYYYRLKIYHTDLSISYSQIQSANVRTSPCPLGG